MCYCTKINGMLNIEYDRGAFNLSILILKLFCLDACVRLSFDISDIDYTSCKHIYVACKRKMCISTDIHHN